MLWPPLRPATAFALAAALGAAGVAAAQSDPALVEPDADLAAALPDPPSQPPSPPRLNAPPPQAAPDLVSGGPAETAATAALPGGVEALPGGGYRLRPASEAEDVPPALARALQELGRRTATQGAAGRVTVEAQVAGPEADASVARRRSLARAIAAKRALVAGGVEPTRIDLRPLGRTEAAADLIDVLPPGARRQVSAATPAR